MRSSGVPHWLQITARQSPHSMGRASRSHFGQYNVSDAGCCSATPNIISPKPGLRLET